MQQCVLTRAVQELQEALDRWLVTGGRKPRPPQDLMGLYELRVRPDMRSHFFSTTLNLLVKRLDLLSHSTHLIELLERFASAGGTRSKIVVAHALTCTRARQQHLWDLGPHGLWLLEKAAGTGPPALDRAANPG